MWETWWDPFDEMRRIRREMDGMFNDFLAKPKYREEGELKGWREPISDVKETKKSVIFKMEIPGVDKDDIQINVTEDSLEVKAQTKQIFEKDEKGVLRRERSYRGFYRSFTLPYKVVPEKVDAKYQNGILEVKLPKTEKEKKKKEVSVKVK